MAYALICNRMVCEIIPEFCDAFPEVPLSERYPADFISSLTEVSDEVKVGMLLLDDGTFAFRDVSDVEDGIASLTFEEAQEEFNLDIDFRITCLELGI